MGEHDVLRSSQTIQWAHLAMAGELGMWGHVPESSGSWAKLPDLDGGEVCRSLDADDLFAALIRSLGSLARRM